MSSLFLRLLTLACLALGFTPVGSAAEPNSADYRLFSRDIVRIAVHGEPDLTVERRIDGNGRISLPMIGSVEVQGLSVTAAEEKIRKTYIEQEILVRPQVALTVAEYFPREVSVLGQVNAPGKVVFPIEAGHISIVDAISKVGGFTRLAKGDSVRVTRRTENGGEDSSTINVEGMIDGKSKVPAFRLLPGDVVFIPERVF